MEVFVSRDFTYVSLSVFQACGTLAWFQKSPLLKKPHLRTAPSHPSLLALQAAAPALGLPQAPVSLLRGPVSRPWGVSFPPADQVLPLTSRCFIGACARAAFLSSPPVRMCCDFPTSSQNVAFFCLFFVFSVFPCWNFPFIILFVLRLMSL